MPNRPSERPNLWICLALAVTAFSGNVARADEGGEPAEQFARGIELADQGAFEAALQAFRRAYELRPHRAVLYNLGQVEAALGRPVEALDYLQRYLAAADGQAPVPAERRKAVLQQIANLKARTGVLVVTVEPAGARVSIDDRVIGTSPLPQPIRVAAGTRRIAAERPGHAPALNAVKVDAGHTEHVTLALAPLTGGTPPPALGWLIVDCPVASEVQLDGQTVARLLGQTTLTALAGSHQVRFAAPHRTAHMVPVELEPLGTSRASCPWPPIEPEELARTQTLSRWSYGLWTGGAVLGGVALGLGLWNERRYDDWQRATLVLPDNPTPAQREEANDDARSIDDVRHLVTGLALGAAVAVVVGVITYVNRGPRLVAEGSKLALRVDW